MNISIKNLNLWYENFHALKDINLNIKEKRITAIIGPSGCGKSTLLRTINRMNDLIANVKINGAIFLEDQNIFDVNFDLTILRKEVGMVFQRPNPFPLSIYENIAFGLKIHGIGKKEKINEIIFKSLDSVMLWDELKDKLSKNALELSLEQKQRLCIARLLAVNPEIILLDEPCSTLDPIATLKIEELLRKLRENYTIVIVTHNMQQAARVSDYTSFMLLGEMIEFDETSKIFTTPRNSRTEDYITGRYG
jgi:phosphate transport system ATP-binding protein